MSEVVERVARHPRQAGHYAWGIMNPYGDWWTPVTFCSEAAAREHLRRFVETCPLSTIGFKYLPVKVRLTRFDTALSTYSREGKDG